MVEDSTPPVGTIQGDVQQDTLPQPTLSCSLDVDAVSNPFGAHDIAEEARDDPYNDFFASSQSLPLQSLPRRIAWYHSLSSLIHLPAKGSIRSYNWHIFSRRTSSNPPSHVHPNGEPVWNVKSGVGNEEEERNKVNHSANSASSAAERQEEPITLIQPSSLINPTSFAEPDSDQGHTVRKLFTRARRKDDSAALTKTTHDPSPEVAEVHAARGFKRYVAYKPKSKKKSPILTISPPPTAADGSGLSQAGIPSHSDALHVHTSPQEPLKPGSQSIFASGHTGQSPQANYASDDSNSDLSIQGPWNKFLNRICFPCGHFYGDDP